MVEAIREEQQRLAVAASTTRATLVATLVRRRAHEVHGLEMGEQMERPGDVGDSLPGLDAIAVVEGVNVQLVERRLPQQVELGFERDLAGAGVGGRDGVRRSGASRFEARLEIPVEPFVGLHGIAPRARADTQDRQRLVDPAEHRRALLENLDRGDGVGLLRLEIRLPREKYTAER